MNEEQREYGIVKQILFLDILISDNDLYARCQHILESEYFEPTLRSTVNFIKKYANDYNSLPTTKVIIAETACEDLEVLNIDEPMREWFLTDFEEFCRRAALEELAISLPDMIEKGEYGSADQMAKDALLISLHQDLGVAFFDEPAEVLQRLRDKKGTVSTGWKIIDEKLYGGFNKGELNIFAAPTGMGKSLFLQNLALNWACMGLNVLFITLELSEDLTASRLASMTTGLTTKAVFSDIDKTSLKILTQGKRHHGKIDIKFLPSGTNSNGIKGFVKTFEMQKQRKIDALLVDYLDLVYPVDKRINPGDLFIKDKFVSEELRKIAIELDVVFATASQLNREALDEIEHSLSQTAGGISKMFTADTAMTAYANTSLKEKGLFKVKFIKTRTSNSQGKTVYLAYDAGSMRISDTEEEIDPNIDPQSTQILNKINRIKTTVSNDEEKTESEPELSFVERKRLMLRQLKN